VCAGALLVSTALADESAATKPSIYVNHKGLVKLTWQLAADGATFGKMKPIEMVEPLHSLTVHHMQLSAAQDQTMSTADADALLAKIKSVKMDFVCMGPIDPGQSEADARATFEFAKKFNMKTIVAYPSDQSLGMLDRLANEYRINVAIRNRPKPYGYWDPKDLLVAITGRSNRIGACADVEAWKASGLVPADCVKELNGHVMVVQLGNFDTTDSADVLKELKDQKFKGICAVGGDAGPDAVAGFCKNVTAFSKIVGDLSGVQ
jgi:hypothetical protein